MMGEESRSSVYSQGIKTIHRNMMEEGSSGSVYSRKLRPHNNGSQKKTVWVEHVTENVNFNMLDLAYCY